MRKAIFSGWRCKSSNVSSLIYGFPGLVFMCLFSTQSIAERVVVINGVKVRYDFSLDSKCDTFLRNPVGEYRAGDSLFIPGLCEKYRVAGNDDLLFKISDVAVLKKDVISLDEMPAWNGVPPIRARYTISAVMDDPDPDINPSYLPYDRKNHVSDYLAIDGQGYEVDIPNGRRTGYRFYQFMNRCYLASEKRPRVYKYFTECSLSKADDSAIPATVDVTSRPWINIMERNTIEKDMRMPDFVEVRGTSPSKPIIYSDFPIDDKGRVTQGRAMCMADCAPGMLLKVLQKGQSIWGLSGKPPRH
ncbi:hypothetical protein [Paraburkholderia phenoliruptrix]|uniref:hypothetical protein n=1 Tax=Paraburkholderia phenoliruptrix TaxID=252970 RepID=UPI002869D790|nr:hypothetical protein [Paraburkholderia phenoliruptrix]WMY07416.1 hypothetical protein P3F88_14195 [Paraburkholderia phenoliruptrix]